MSGINVAALAAGLLAVADAPAAHGPTHPIWIGRPRSRSRGRLFFAFHRGTVKAPAGYGFTKRGDLINLRKRAARLARRMS